MVRDSGASPEESTAAPPLFVSADALAVAADSVAVSDGVLSAGELPPYAARRGDTTECVRVRPHSVVARISRHTEPGGISCERGTCATPLIKWQIVRY